MNKYIAVILLFASFSSHSSILGEGKDWDFIQSVGGIKVSNPTNKNGKWLLPVLCDVSGLSTITHKPKMMNSAIVISKTKTKVIGNIIYITIETGLTDISGNSTQCSPINIGNLNPGKYVVKYLSPNGKANDLHSFEIGL
mgnify:CR=1 FL=1